MLFTLQSELFYLVKHRKLFVWVSKLKHAICFAINLIKKMLGTYLTRTYFAKFKNKMVNNLFFSVPVPLDNLGCDCTRWDRFSVANFLNKLILVPKEWFLDRPGYNLLYCLLVWRRHVLLRYHEKPSVYGRQLWRKRYISLLSLEQRRAHLEQSFHPQNKNLKNDSKLLWLFCIHTN